LHVTDGRPLAQHPFLVPVRQMPDQRVPEGRVADEPPAPHPREAEPEVGWCRIRAQLARRTEPGAETAKDWSQPSADARSGAPRAHLRLEQAELRAVERGVGHP